MSKFNIGIDTGGTYTDAAVVDMQSRQVLASAKAITTHGDLSIGVSNSLQQVLSQLGSEFQRDEISLVSISTTLATNALVEGQGGSVATFLIGFDDGMAERTRIAQAVPDAHIVRINGGHIHTGEELDELDDDAINAAIDTVIGNVDAYAVAAHYSVRNSSHERRAKEIIHTRTRAPVTVSSDLSDALDGPRRALTATLNARIVSRIVSLVSAVRESLKREHIDARLMIVKGDGSLASADLVIERPIETILSGPAASVIGARYLTDEKDFIISDIGGTTTDIAIARNGWPDISEKGSVVGEYRTLVQAIDMRTTGLGGDSEVIVDYGGKISLAGTRAVPVSMLGSRWPNVTAHIRAVLSAAQGFRTACRFLLRPEGYDSTVWPTDLHAGDAEFLGLISDKPVPWAELVHRVSDDQRALRLASRGLIQISGFTPSDAAHVLGRQSQWCQETARLACRALGHSCGRVSRNGNLLDDELNEFAQAITDAVVRKSCHLLIERLGDQRFDTDNPLVAGVTSGDMRLGDLRIALAPEIPVIAVGGPAGLYYPDVGRRLGTQTIIPQHSAVANAIGAAVGMIKVRVAIEVTSGEGGGFLVHTPGDPLLVNEATAALKKAEEQASLLAIKQAETMGAVDVQVTFDVRRVDLPDMGGDLGLVAATVTAECMGHLR